MMSEKDIKTICLKLESLHEKILKSKFAEKVYESEMMSLIIAIGELEKQIPKKPVIHGYREGREVNTISYTCPVCNKHIDKDNYCKHCGNALDWSGE